jgi:glutaminyl-tRNA synthetase
LPAAKLEPSVRSATPGASFQFERMGYFCVDKESAQQHLIFNRSVSLRDSWAKMEKGQK